MTRYLLLLALPLLLAAADAPKMMRVPLKFRDTGDLAVAPGSIRLRRVWRQEPGQPIVFEAEEATMLELQNLDHRIAVRDDCSGGRGVVFAKELAFAFEVTTPGDYEVRLRAWFPLAATWMHRERLNDGPVNAVYDSQSRDPDVWWWTEGPTYTLAAGRNTYLFPSPTAWCGGCTLDKVVLVPKGRAAAIEGLGPPQSPIVSPDEATAVTWRTKLQRIRRWQLDFETVPNGGVATVESAWSADGPWQSVDAGKLNDLPSPKPRYLYFRFHLQAAPGQPSPAIQGLNFTIEKEPRE